MRTLFLFTIFSLIFVAIAPKTSSAQPTLQFTRIVNNWPTIELYMKITCGGEELFPKSKQYFSIRENGREITEFTQWCPDPRQRCATSAALVFDASSSMAGAGNQKAKEGGNAFIDLYDGMIDEAAVIWSTSTQLLKQDMTTNRNNLHGAIDALPAAGASAIWDGIYYGLEVLISKGNNPCRAVLVFSDGVDNASKHTPDEIIAFANRNRIRVFTIGYGKVSPEQLETIALLTGGKYYHAPSPLQIANVYYEISTIIFGAFQECLITYQATCQNGTIRSVDLELKDMCGGGDVKTRSYRAPKDTSTFALIDLGLPRAYAAPGTKFLMPLELLSPVGNGLNLGKIAFTLRFPEKSLEFIGVHTPPGTLLNGESLTASSLEGGARVHFAGSKYIAGTGTLAELEFRVRHFVPSGDIEIGVDSMDIAASCWHPKEAFGTVTVLDYGSPIITTNATTLCEGSAATLTCTDGFHGWSWSNGDTGESITVDIPGEYTVRAVNEDGDTLTSPPITITVRPVVNVGIAPHTPVICNGEPDYLTADGGFAAYRWSNGYTTRSIYANTPGAYYVDVMTDVGCWGRSDTVFVVAGNRPKPLISGPQTVCLAGATYSYETAYDSTSRFQWSVQGGQIITPADSHRVEVCWIDGRKHSLTVHETNMYYGCSADTTIDVRTLHPAPRVQVSYVEICPGGSTVLKIGNGYTSYLWSTGETTDSIIVTQPGDYYCEVAIDSCTGMSDTVRVSLIPSMDLNITGNTIVCENERVNYTVTYFDTDYDWVVNGGKIVHGDGSSSVDIVWQRAAFGELICRAQVGGCIGWDTLRVAIAPATKPMLSAEGPLEFCQGDSVVLHAEPGFPGYKWSNGETTSSITVKQRGEYWVGALDTNGCTGYSDTVAVWDHVYPPKPTINRVGDRLRCSVSSSYANYKWYRNAVLLSISEQDLYVTETGVYVVSVGFWGDCDSTSEPYVVVSLGVRTPSLARSFSIAPNPSNGDFTVALEFERPTAFSMRIVNAAGQLLYNRTIHEQRTSYHGSVALDGASAGVYFLILESNNMYDFRKVVIR